MKAYLVEFLNATGQTHMVCRLGRDWSEVARILGTPMGDDPIFRVVALADDLEAAKRVARKKWREWHGS